MMLYFEEEVNIKFAIREEANERFLKSITDTFAGRIKPKLLGKRIDCK